MKKIILASVAVLLMASQAQAACPTRPENASSDYVTNGVNQSVCQQDELRDTTRQINENARFQSLQKYVTGLQIQRKFDNLIRR